MITETDNNFDIEPEENEDIHEDICYADGRFEDEYEDDEDTSGT